MSLLKFTGGGKARYKANSYSGKFFTQSLKGKSDECGAFAGNGYCLMFDGCGGDG